MKTTSHLHSKSVLFITCSILFFQNVCAQNSLRDESNQVFFTPNMYMQTYGVQDGSPYLDAKFTPARINDKEKTNLVRFNAYEGKVEVSVEANKAIELSQKEPFRIHLLDGSDRKFITTQYRGQKGKVGNSFFQVLHEGEGYTLYLQERIKYFKKAKAEGYKAAKPARFEKARPHFYVGTKKGIDEVLTYLPSKGNKLAQVFSKKNGAKVKALIKKENPNLSSKDGLIQILDAVY